MTLLNLCDVSLKFPEANKIVLNQINYTVHRGDFIILLGSNGSGKSTLLKLLHRHYQPNSGQIHFIGNPIHHFSDKEFSQHVAVLTQNCSDSLFTSLTVFENYILMNKKKKLLQSKKMNERQFLSAYLTDFNPNLANKLDQIVDQLSGGEKQALALALCLMHPPSLLLLDEHTSALDPKTSDQIMQLTQKKIAAHNITCILTTHDLDIATRYGNRVLILCNGEIRYAYDKEEKDALSKEKLIANYY